MYISERDREMNAYCGRSRETRGRRPQKTPPTHPEAATSSAYGCIVGLVVFSSCEKGHEHRPPSWVNSLSLVVDVGAWVYAAEYAYDMSARSTERDGLYSTCACTHIKVRSASSRTSRQTLYVCTLARTGATLAVAMTKQRAASVP